MTQPAAERRRHASGEATRLLLLETAERLFAAHGIDGVTVRDIQLGAGQSNASVIAYHFGTKTDLIRALIKQRQESLDTERAALLAQMREAGTVTDARSVVWLLAYPLAISIRSGEMYAAFLARLSEDPAVRSEYWPAEVDDHWNDSIEELVAGTIPDMPQRLRRGRSFQLTNSVIHVLAEHARTSHQISDAMLANYVDGWVGLLTAPLTEAQP